jgi:hypothetical protein
LTVPPSAAMAVPVPPMADDVCTVSVLPLASSVPLLVSVPPPGL